MGNLNVYSAKGKETHIEFKKLVESPKKDKKSLFKVLNELSLKKYYHLGLYVAQRPPKHYTIGDNSYFYIYDIVGKQKTGRYGKDVMEYLQVVPSAMAAWQIYLLSTSYTVLPYWWHGGYSARIFIFDLEDLKKLKNLPDDIGLSISTNSLLPQVEMKGNISYVKCCYWNNWKGLVREVMKIEFTNDGVKSLKVGEGKILYKYNCGICY